MYNPPQHVGNLATANSVSPIRQLPAPTAPPPKFKVTTTAMVPGKTEIQGAPTIGPAAPRVSFTPEVAIQMNYIVDACKDEVGWMGYVEKLPASGNSEHFLITRIFIPEQEVHSATTEISPAGLNAIAFQLMDEHKDPGQLIAWFHSHVNMGVTPSGQDEEMIARHLESNPVMIRGIMNKKGAIKVDVYYRDHGVAFTCVTTGVHYPMTGDPTAGLDEVLKKNVVEMDTGFVLGNYQGGGYQMKHAEPWPSRASAARVGTLLDDTDDDDIYGYPIGKGVSDGDTDLYLPETASHIETGYGRRWTVQTPIPQRPKGWMQDDEYWDRGYDHDRLAEDAGIFT